MKLHKELIDQIWLPYPVPVPGTVRYLAGYQKWSDYPSGYPVDS